MSDVKITARRRFSISFKLHCVRQHEISNNLRRTARKMGVNRSTLRNWIKYKIFLENVSYKSNSFF